MVGLELKCNASELNVHEVKLKSSTHEHDVKRNACYREHANRNRTHLNAATNRNSEYVHTSLHGAGYYKRVRGKIIGKKSEIKG